MDEQLTLEEQVDLIAGSDMWHTGAVPRAGLPAVRMSDGPNGVRGTSFADPPSALFPCGAALGATWDPALVREVGAELAAESEAKGVDLLLAPTVNLVRSPLGGRNFETFGEDPQHVARLAVAYVRGVQERGVACCIKHFIANDVEFERNTVDSVPDDRTLREVLLAPFEAAIQEADVRSVMASYNRLHGTYASEHPWLLTTLLRGEWGFDGLVVSDWFATQSTAPALLAGLDVEMPGPAAHRGQRLLDAVRAGEVLEEDVARAAGRVVDLLRWRGLIGTDPDRSERARRDPGTAAVLRRTAAAGTVLLRNEGGLLPLDAERVRRVALIGPFVDGGAAHGGGSAALHAEALVTPRDGLAARVREVVVEPGVHAFRTLPPLDPSTSTTPDGAPGVLLEELDASGAVTHTETHAQATVFGSPDPAALRITARFTPTTDGAWTFGITSTGPGTIRVGGELVVDDREPEPGGTLLGFGSREARGRIELRAGEPVDLVAETDAGEATFLAGIAVGALAPQPADLLERAVAAAADADVAVVIVGTGAQWESEGADREQYGLPGEQDELVRRVAVANPQTVVVVAAGSAVQMDWAEEVPAILQTWFAGQEGGNALADVLFGDAEPGGRLPVTIPHRIEDTGAYLDVPGEAGVLRYGERQFLGQRFLDARGIEPRYPLGHGLGYTTFVLRDLRATGDAPAGDLVLEADVENTGARSGKVVVQAYLEPPPGPLRRPARSLAGFAVAEVPAGDQATLRVSVPRRAFEVWDPQAGAWTLPVGRYVVHGGFSSRDLPEQVELALEAVPAG